MSARAASDKPAVTVVVPGDLETRTGGYGYDRRIIAGLRERGWPVEVRPLDDSFPFPTAAARTQAASVLAAIADDATVLIDGLALGALPDEVERERERLRIIALVHHPLAAETGLDLSAAAALEASERRALAAVRFVVVTGRATAAALARYGVARERIAVVEPGTDRAPLARGSWQKATLRPEPFDVALLCVASLTTRKGHDILFRALASMPQRRWRLTCAGSLDRDGATVERLRAQLQADGLEDRISLVGDLDANQLAVEYDRADVFVLPTLYEGYGMAVAEAVARGLPVVSTATGSIPEMVTSESGVIVAPGDLVAFTDALARVIGDEAQRQRLADGARRVRDRLQTWDDSVTAMEHVLASVAAPPGARYGTRYLGFSAGWLELREPADRGARSATLARKVAAALPQDADVGVLDLGAGTGANMRYLTSLLPYRQRWLLLDHDAALLASVPTADTGSRHVETRQFDLNALNADLGRELFSGRALVTASALLDLVSADWLRALAARCRDNGATLLFALSYDGRIHFSPEEAEDAEIRALVNEHQRTDKGFGQALGPDAPAVAAQLLAGVGYHVERERTDWELGPESPELQRQLIAGWAHAASEIAPSRQQAIDDWRTRRLVHVSDQRSRLIVGHQDLAAWLPGARVQTW